MICPKNPINDYDNLDCRDCEKYQECFDKWFKTENFNVENFDKNNFGEDSAKLDRDKIYEIGKESKKENLTVSEQEVIYSINMIGSSSTWLAIEAIGNAEVRGRYRMIFFKVGGIMPEKEE